jgi:hypothetical protein
VLWCAVVFIGGDTSLGNLPCKTGFGLGLCSLGGTYLKLMSTLMTPLMIGIAMAVGMSFAG